MLISEHKPMMSGISVPLLKCLGEWGRVSVHVPSMVLILCHGEVCSHSLLSLSCEELENAHTEWSNKLLPALYYIMMA